MEPENSLPPVPCSGQSLRMIEEDEKSCHAAAFAIQTIVLRCLLSRQYVTYILLDVWLKQV